MSEDPTTNRAQSASGASGSEATDGSIAQQVRIELDEQRRQIAEMHRRGLDGQQVCGRLTSLVDRLLVRLYDDALASMGAELGNALRGEIALVALGSYGRRQSAPFSDVDLMILHGGVVDAQLTALVRRFTHSIYDARFALGHSVRTCNEAVNLARQDAIICSSLIDSRLVAGNQALYQEFRDLFQKMVRRRARGISLALHEARGAERAQYGESIYLLEPHVKRSRGGLRDLHLIQWLGYVEHGESDPDRLHLQGAMSKFDHRRLVSARDYLLRLRNEMHFFAGSTRDGLDRAEQVRVAGWLGHRQREGLLPVEHFMRDYFRHANHLWQMVRRREATLHAAPTTMTRILDPVFGRKVTGDFRISARHVSATPQGLAKLHNNLDEILRLVDLTSRENKLLDHNTWSHLVLAAPELGDGLSEEVARRFWEALGNPSSVGATLRLLHELGYLEKIVPAVRRARCLLQFNQYHKYTVDEHSLRAVDFAAECVRRQDALGAICREIQERSLLHFALLMHDLGKGDEEDHSIVGARLTRETAELLRLSGEEAVDAEFLVRHHLEMAHVAFRRDTSDPTVVGRFADLVGSARRLRLLFVLTCADLAAVGPDVLNQWKIEVLLDLYRRTRAHWENAEGEASDRLRAMVDVQQALPKAAQSDAWFQRQLEAFPANFLASLAAKEVAQMLVAFRSLSSREAIAWGAYRPESQTVELVAGVESGIGRGAFSAMAGALASKGLQILSANAQILPSGILLLHYAAIDPDHPEGSPPERLKGIESALADAVDGDYQPKFRRVFGQEQAEATARLTGLPNKVRIDNEGSDKATIVEVYTFDRTGLLFDLARRLHDLELTICHAKISTYLDQVVDVFYVTERAGGKVAEPQRLETLQREMLQAIEVTPSG